MKMPAKIFKMHAKTYEQEPSKIFAENREDLGQNFWNIEKEKDKEKVGGRPAKLNEKKSHIQLEREIKKERGHYFFIGRTTWKFCSGGEKMRNASGGEKMRKFNATTSCKSTWDTVPHLCIDGLSIHDLVLVIPPPPLIKVASNTRPYSKLRGTTLNGREEGGQYYILQTCDQERFEARKVVFPWECLIIFATGCSYYWYHIWSCILHDIV